MKFIKVLIFLLISANSFAQYYSPVKTPIQWTQGGFDSLFIPARDTITPGDKTKPWITYRAPTLYVWTTNKWTAISGGGGGGGTDYTLPQADSNTLGGIRYNTDLALDLNNRLGIAPGKKALWNTIANLPLFYATGDSTRGMIRDSIAKHKLKFNPNNFNIFPDSVDIINKPFTEADSIYMHDPAHFLTSDDITNIQNIDDTSIHPRTSDVHTWINGIRQDTVKFNSAQFYKTLDDVVNIYGGDAVGGSSNAVVTTTDSLRTLSNIDPGTVYETTDKGGGFWKYDPFDITTPDNTGTIIVNGTKRLKRIYSGTLNALWWGMVGDGVTDNYDQIQALVAYINSMGGNTQLIFPKGTYYINRYKITAGAGANTIKNISFSNCKNLKIYGYGAIISVKGDFNRRWTTGTTFRASADIPIIPMEFAYCSNVSVEGLELNGNVDKMTKDSGVTEAPAHGLWIGGCTDMTFKNMYIHHFAADGIILTAATGTPKVSSQRATFENVRSWYNARQGLTIGNSKYATFTNCDFSYTGKSAGAYGGHSPQAGVDFEPDYVVPVSDVNPGEISFYNCHFISNTGTQITSNPTTSNAFFYGGIVDASDYLGTYSVICNMYNLVFDGTQFTTGKSSIYTAWSSGLGQKATFRNCRVYSASSGFLATVTPQYGLTIENCHIYGQHTEPLNTYFPYISSKNTTFKDNYIFYDSAAYGGNNAGLIQNSDVSNNTFVTDIDTSNGSTKTVNISYTNSFVTNEHYPKKGIIGIYGVPYIISDTTVQRTGSFNLVSQGSRMSNYPGATTMSVPNSILNLQTKFGDYFYNGFTQSMIGAASGLVISTPFTNASNLMTGGYQIAISNPAYMPLETSMSAFTQQTGEFYWVSKTGLTKGVPTALDQIMRLNATGLSLRGTAPLSGLDLKASTTASASINIPSGVRPTSPVNGDVWQTGGHTYMRISGADAQLDNSSSGVTSVGLSMPGVIFNSSVTNSPITSSGVLTPTLADQVPFSILGNHASSIGQPTFGKIPVQSISATGYVGSGSKFLSDDGTWRATSSSMAYVDSPEHAFGGTITFTGTTAPAGVTSYYRWTRVGNKVDLTIHFRATTAGTAITSTTWTLPADCPTPGFQTGTLTGYVGYPGTGWMSASNNMIGVASVNSTVSIYPATGNVPSIVLTQASSNYISGVATVTYWAAGIAP